MYDLLIKGGRLIDPAAGRDGNFDVAFENGKVARVAPSIAPGEARETLQAEGRVVAPGLIDLHTHIWWGGTTLGVEAEPLARRSGTTTLVDAGSAGAGTFHGFRRFIAEPAPVRVIAFLNISFPGIYAFSERVMVGECQDLRLLDPVECLRVAKEHEGLICGIKVRCGMGTSLANGLAPLDLALEVATELGVPLMAHVDGIPPTRKDALARMRKGDILTHCFRPFPNGPAIAGAIRPEMVEARERGIVMDIGHGKGSFGFASTRVMLEAGYLPDVISSDVHTLCEHGPAYDLPTTMGKLMSMGVPLEEVIRASTTAPAMAVRRPDLGTLAEGAPGEAVLLDIDEGSFDYVDVVGEHMQGRYRIRPHSLVVGGRVWEGQGAH
jgi:dihydroorotase